MDHDLVVDRRLVCLEDPLSYAGMQEHSLLVWSLKMDRSEGQRPD